MGNKSLLGNALALGFSLAAYIIYIFSMVNSDTKWMLITAFIYFLPIFVDFAEDMQAVVFKKKLWFKLCICLFAVGLLYFIFLFSYLSLPEDMSGGFVSDVLKVSLVIIPAVCLPIKVYPLSVTVMQLYNRMFGGQ